MYTSLTAFNEEGDSLNSCDQTRMERQHIFAVDGAPDFLDIIREWLQGEDYNVTTTNFAPETFDQIAALDPALLIIDLVVGDRFGRDLLARVTDEARTQRTPVIIVSTNQQLLDEVQAGPPHLAEHRVLRKPFDLDELLRVVVELVGPA